MTSQPTWLERAFPALTAIVVIGILATSQVPPNLWAFAGRPAAAVMAFYTLPNFWLAINPDDIRAHYLAGGLAVFVWGGRAGGFVELVLSEPPRWDLLGAVGERILLLALVLAWHIYGGHPKKTKR